MTYRDIVFIIIFYTQLILLLRRPLILKEKPNLSSSHLPQKNKLNFIVKS